MAGVRNFCLRIEDAERFGMEGEMKKAGIVKSVIIVVVLAAIILPFFFIRDIEPDSRRRQRS